MHEKRALQRAAHAALPPSPASRKSATGLQRPGGRMASRSKVAKRTARANDRHTRRLPRRGHSAPAIPAQAAHFIQSVQERSTKECKASGQLAKPWSHGAAHGQLTLQVSQQDATRNATSEAQPALQHGIFQLALAQALERHAAAWASVASRRSTGITLRTSSESKNIQRSAGASRSSRRQLSNQAGKQRRNLSDNHRGTRTA